MDRFLPRWTTNPLSEHYSSSLFSKLPPTLLQNIDHLAMNQVTGTMNNVASWYSETLLFKRFWSKDDTIINSGHSGLKSIFMINDDNEKVKLTINEPIHGSHKSQIQEFLDYHQGPGVQHVAFNTENIEESIIQLKDRGKFHQKSSILFLFQHFLYLPGVEFLETPSTYYKNLEKRLKNDGIEIQRDISSLHKHNILVDYDQRGHLYQIFTRPIQDRPTIFLELIERHHFGGFGAGNIKALFESIEEEQKQRGNV